MKVLVTLAIFCFLQAIASQVIKDGSKLENQKHGDHENQAPSQMSGDKGHEINSNQNSNKEQHIAAQNQHVQHAEHAKPIVKIPHSSEPSKESVEIPPKGQHVDTQVAQQIPHVETQHGANKQRMVRSVKNRLGWQAMQVNALEQPGKCKFICNPLDTTTVCGYNGRCHWEFESQCDLSTYNCLNTQTIFDVVDFAKCQDIGAAKCYRGDM